MTKEQSRAIELEHDELARLAKAAELLCEASSTLLEHPQGKLVDPENLAMSKMLIDAAQKLTDRHRDGIVVTAAFIAECTANNQ